MTRPFSPAALGLLLLITAAACAPTDEQDPAPMPADSSGVAEPTSVPTPPAETEPGADSAPPDLRSQIPLPSEPRDSVRQGPIFEVPAIPQDSL